VPNLVLYARCGAGYCVAWHELQLIVVLVKVLGVHAGYLWQVSQVVGYFCVLAVWVTGLFAKWHDWQLVVTPVCEYFTVAHSGYVWQFEQTVG
jgi:hypothetical protein